MGLGEGGKAGEAVNTKPSYYLMQSIITLFLGVYGIGGGGVFSISLPSSVGTLECLIACLLVDNVCHT